MSGHEGTMGKLILLQRVREDAAREALASSNEEVDRACAEERGADGRRRAAGEALSDAQRAPSGEAPLAQVLHLADLRRRQLRDVFVAMEAHFAKLRDERITAEQARERMRADWEANRERRKQLEERLRAMRREGWRKRERVAESARDDLPPRGKGDGGGGDGG